MNSRPSKILIVKTGSTYPELKKSCGDFEHWIAAILAEKGFRSQTIPVARLEPDRLVRFQGIIFTGSHSSLTQPYAYLKGLERVIDVILNNKIPTLGICFGHQLIHYLMGGEVIRNPLGLEIGITRLSLTIEGMSDPLFSGMNPVRTDVYSSHADVVTRTAPGSVILARSDQTDVQATRIVGHIGTIQFHPEYDRDRMAFIIRKNWDWILNQHYYNPLYVTDPHVILSRNRQIRNRKQVLFNFCTQVSAFDERRSPSTQMA